jgi:hypothetical protein
MQDIEIQFTDKEISPWGGMILLKKMLEKTDFKQQIGTLASLPQPGSNRGYKPYIIIESFITSVWCGANRFLHTEVTRHDKVLSGIFGWEQAPAQDVYKRYFCKFNQSINNSVFGKITHWLFNNIKIDNITVDFDSTIMTRYGQQQGASKGYNRVKPGRNSHHPLMAFVDDCKMVANFWLRPGNSYTSNNFKTFLSDTLARLEGKRIGLLRLDSGFYDKEVFEYIEECGLNYIVAAKFYEPIQKVIASEKGWLKIDEGIEIAQIYYKSPLWDKPRRMVMVRQYLPDRPKATGKGLSLFTDEGIYKRYKYSCYITNLDLSSSDIWRLYRQRANAENRIKELKYDFGFDSFNMNNFWGTEAALNFVMIAYNFMSLFRLFIINSSIQERLSTLRFNTFAIGAYFVKDGRNVVLKLSLALKRREWFTGLWNASKQFSVPVIFSNA